MKTWKDFGLVKKGMFLDRNILVTRILNYLCGAMGKAVLPARVAELVDALDSKSSDSNIVRVRFPPRVL